MQKAAKKKDRTENTAKEDQQKVNSKMEHISPNLSNVSVVHYT